MLSLEEKNSFVRSSSLIVVASVGVEIMRDSLSSKWLLKYYLILLLAVRQVHSAGSLGQAAWLCSAHSGRTIR